MGTKQNLFSKQRTAKINPKILKKNHKITKSKKIFPIFSCVCCEHQINLLFLLSLFFANYFFLVCPSSSFLLNIVNTVCHMRLVDERIYLFFRNLSVILPGNCGQWPSPWVKLRGIVRDMRKIMGDGCWLQFPQRLREPGPGSFESPPPPHRILYLMCFLAKIFNPCGLMAKCINFCGPVALFTLYNLNKLMF